MPKHYGAASHFGLCDVIDGCFHKLGYLSVEVEQSSCGMGSPEHSRRRGTFLSVFQTISQSSVKVSQPCFTHRTSATVVSLLPTTLHNVKMTQSLTVTVQKTASRGEAGQPCTDSAVMSRPV